MLNRKKMIFQDEEVDNNSAEMEKKREKSLRTLVYISVLVLLLLLMSILGVIIAVSSYPFTWEQLSSSQNNFKKVSSGLNNMFNFLGSFFLAPLYIVIPPLFRMRKTRQISSAIMSGLALAVFFIKFLTALLWGSVAGRDSLILFNFALALNLISSGLMTTSFGRFFAIDLKKILRKDSPQQYQRHVDSSNDFVYHLLNFMMTVMNWSIENGLDRNPHLSGDKEVEDKATVSRPQRFDSVLPIFFFCWLFILYYHHYTRCHTGWYTYHRCRKQVEILLLQASMSHHERSRFRVQRTGSKIIKGIMSSRLFSKNCCPC